MQNQTILSANPRHYTHKHTKKRRQFMLSRVFLSRHSLHFSRAVLFAVWAVFWSRGALAIRGASSSLSMSINPLARLEPTRSRTAINFFVPLAMLARAILRALATQLKKLALLQHTHTHTHNVSCTCERNRARARERDRGSARECNFRLNTLNYKDRACCVRKFDIAQRNQNN